MKSVNYVFKQIMPLSLEISVLLQKLSLFHSALRRPNFQRNIIDESESSLRYDEHFGDQSNESPSVDLISSLINQIISSSKLEVTTGVSKSVSKSVSVFVKQSTSDMLFTKSCVSCISCMPRFPYLTSTIALGDQLYFSNCSSKSPKVKLSSDRL